MAAGRLIFGLGAESMIVAITTIIARWFKGKELSFAFGINLTIARLGSFLALNSPLSQKSLHKLAISSMDYRLCRNSVGALHHSLLFSGLFRIGEIQYAQGRFSR